MGLQILSDRGGRQEGREGQRKASGRSEEKEVGEVGEDRVSEPLEYLSREYVPKNRRQAVVTMAALAEDLLDQEGYEQVLPVPQRSWT
ncbi:hypothetical protein LIER_25901 [Lithospermum erythrorhizon]|uniref:Uncharacterized protein n=1 Tax=Lithospermum erythrorhizon TaxID=34254 RepID=A0AAV3R807_LITER